MPELYCAAVNEVVIRSCEDAYVGDCNLTCGQTSAVIGTASPRAERIYQSNVALRANGEGLYGSIWDVLVGRAIRMHSDRITGAIHETHTTIYSCSLGEK